MLRSRLLKYLNKDIPLNFVHSFSIKITMSTSHPLKIFNYFLRAIKCHSFIFGISWSWNLTFIGRETIMGNKVVTRAEASNKDLTAEGRWRATAVSRNGQKSIVISPRHRDDQVQLQLGRSPYVHSTDMPGYSIPLLEIQSMHAVRAMAVRLDLSSSFYLRRTSWESSPRVAWTKPDLSNSTNKSRRGKRKSIPYPSMYSLISLRWCDYFTLQPCLCHLR